MKMKAIEELKTEGLNISKSGRSKVDGMLQTVQRKA